jgi:putative endonuclease
VAAKQKNTDLTNGESSTKQKGDKAEQIAADYLIHKGYTVLARNWRWQRAELDLVCMDGNSLVIVEVKSRSYNSLGEPEESITPAKEALLLDAARQYAYEINHEWEVRIDIIAILMQEKSYQLRHFIDAIY